MYRFVIILFALFLCGKTIFAQNDVTPPDTPVLDSVSVADYVTGSVYVSWFPSDSADVAGYVIYRYIVNWDSITTVFAPNTSYLDTGADADYHPERYRIAAFDEVNNISPMTDSTLYHNTIYVFPYQDSTNCQTSIRINWNEYINWSEGVSEYKVYMSENYGTWNMLATVPGNISEYYHQNISDNTSYCYYIRAVSNSGRTSTSNQTCFFTNLPDFPHFINADYATVISDERIKISFTLDTAPNIEKNYKLLRAESINGPYIQLSSYQNYTSLNLVYYDNVDVTKKWCYKLFAINHCGNTVVESNIAQNIVVTVTSNDDVTELVNWETYYNWLGGVEYYNIYRIADNLAPVLIGTSNFNTTFIDNVADYAVNRTGVSGKFCYYIEAIEGNSNPYGVKGVSNSNKSCAVQFSRVFVPNAFTPDGDTLNSEFLPIVSFVRSDKYNFKVFDRWGEKIFETSDPLKGWDGKIHGNRVQAGIYIYFFTYIDSYDKVKEKTE